MLHPGQNRYQGPFHLGVQLPEPFGLDPGSQDLLDPPGRVGVLAGIGRHPRHLDLVHPPLLLPLADQVGDRNHRVAKQPLRKLVEVVVALAAFEQVAEDHRIGDRPLDRHPRAAQGEHVILEVLPDLLDLGIGQDRPQGLEHLVGIEDPAMDWPAQRQVIRKAGLPAHGDAHERRAQRIDVGRLGVDAEPGLPLQLGQKVPEQLGRIHDPIVGHPGLDLACGLGRRQLAHEAMKSALDAQGLEGIHVRFRRLQCLPVQIECQVVAQGHQQASPPGCLGVLAEALLLLRPFHLFDVLRASCRASRTL